jgi:hypothetical protein
VVRTVLHAIAFDFSAQSSSPLLSSTQQALERKLNNPFLHIALYQIAFLQSDAAVMTQQVAWSVGKPGVEQPHPPPSATINL